MRSRVSRGNSRRRGREVMANDPPEPPVAERRLLSARLGGAPAIERIIDGLYARLEKDRRLKRLFGRRRARARRALALFMDELLGGEPRYTGAGLGNAGMQRRHVHFALSAHEVELWLEHFAASLRAEGIDEGLAGEVMGVIVRPARRLV